MTSATVPSTRPAKCRRSGLTSCDRCAGRTARGLPRWSNAWAAKASCGPADYWNVSFLACWTGGTMGLYLKDVQPWFGSVPVRDIGLIASEGRMTVPVGDGTPGGILDVAGHFYEFIPAEEIDSDKPTVLRCHELQVGQGYFLVLTTSSGLARYSIMDLVRVNEYFGEAPVLEFLSKGQRICSLAGEKLTENQVVLAGEGVRRESGWRLGDFALCPRWGKLPGYMLYVDGECEAPLDALAAGFDQALCRISMEYASKRKTLRLAEVTARYLPAGFLAELDRDSLARGRGRAEQFKHRFLYTTPGADGTWPAKAEP